ncbi:MAG: PAS domain S-box protein [Nanoarchaeota archaeon]|nr:PAS domain S-box protein [Nanoarchaeota archaeon]
MTHNSKSEYKTLFNTLSDAILIFDSRGRLKDLNKAALKLFKLNKVKSLGASVFSLIKLSVIKLPEDIISNLVKRTKKLLAGKELEPIEWKYTDSRGNNRFIIGAPSIIKEKCRFAGFSVIFKEVTNYKNIERELKSRIEELNLLSNILTELVALSNKENIYKFICEKIGSVIPEANIVSAFYEKNTGKVTVNYLKLRKQASLLERRSIKLLINESFPFVYGSAKSRRHYDFFKLTNAKVKKSLKSVPKLVFDNLFKLVPNLYQLLLYNKGNLELIITIQQRRELENYELIHALGSILSIALEKKSDSAKIIRSEERYRSVIRSIPVGMHFYELKNNNLFLTGANPAADKILKIKHTKLVGKKILEAFPGLKNTRIPEYYVNVAKTGKLWISKQVNYEKGRIKGVFEVHAFKTGHNKMAASFREISKRIEAENKLRDSEQKFRNIVKNTPGMVYIGFSEWRAQILSGCKPLTGYNTSDFEAKKISWTDLIHKEDKNKVLEDALKLNKKPAEIIQVYRIITREKVLKWVEDRKSSFFKEGKFAGVIGVVFDITERVQAEKEVKKANIGLKKSLAEKEFLLTELHHRVKNNMQVIISLLNLQAQASSEQKIVELLNESRNRIQAMAFIHEMLYKSKDLKEINFSDYVTELVNYLINSYGFSRKNLKIKINIQKLNFNIDNSIYLALLLNELVSNSLQHAFTKQKKKEIEIRMKRKAGKTYELVVSNSGVKFPSYINIRGAKTLGLQLVNMIVDQFRGKISLDRSKGASFKIDLHINNS